MPDGKSLTVARREDDGTWTFVLVPVEGNRPETVGAIGAADIARMDWGGSNGIAISPDGKRAIYDGSVTIRAKSELWTLDLTSLLAKQK